MWADKGEERSLFDQNTNGMEGTMKFKTIVASLIVVLVAGTVASAGDSPDQKTGQDS